ncbi:hypothetical protein [Pannonibacter indicus]|uniref:PGN_0703 family putative restriction endonuclease n=1 Tax=Pannonibacter indicus TaxID=466044 RepID=UPI0035B4C69B
MAADFRSKNPGYTAPMDEHGNSSHHIRSRALAALREAFLRQRPGVQLDGRGYATNASDTVLPLVSPGDFEADLSAGDGRELQTKFKAVHSSSGLCVNCFSPFRRSISSLSLPAGAPFGRLQFERKCPTGLRGGRAPNLDVLLDGLESVVGIESKLTEHLGKHRAGFSPAYAEQIRDTRRQNGYFQEMQRLQEEPDHYLWLDAAQLIKHAFGLEHTYSGRPVTLLYLFWEPANPATSPVFAAHRAETARFAERVQGSSPGFAAMSYPELWTFWRQTAPLWLSEHLASLEARYLVQI